ncbi:ABC transporter ATP-binding protein [Lentibacillus saliphilus]|uniref:ABC transporter ATP-binding protein n=1 Tax=Lentibacillus saliphilus TaxID=2737028 RepID=UPI001C304972|nr:ABC transporter ATP-binding protein [Lentibacillus saliphilus]
MYIQIKELSFSYGRSQKPIINNFNLEIAKGDIVSILGESGSGKSTILRLICGLETPVCGSISINKQMMSDGRHCILPEKRSIGMMFQDYALFPHMSVADNVQFGLKHKSRKDKRKRVDQVLELVNMSDFRNRYPHELSGGQQQRIALARSLAPEPSLLLMDEPFSNLDADLQIKIRNELRDIIKATGTTSIFVTHDREDARAIADRIITMREGSAYEWDSLCTIDDLTEPALVD